MIKLTRNSVGVIAMLLVFACGNGSVKSSKGSGSAEQIMVFAAASLTNVLTDIVDSFEVENNVRIQLNLASSGTLARQITQGEIPNLYISASKKWASYIDSLGYIQEQYKSVVAKNSLVLIAPRNSLQDNIIIDSALNITSFLGKERLSMGDPLHVPAGKYAQQALKYYGLYDGIESRLLPAKDVRSALMVVEMSETPLGIVYKTDAAKSRKVKVLATFPSQSHEPIVYNAGVCNLNEYSKEFFSYLNSDEAKLIWERHGFKN